MVIQNYNHPSIVVWGVSNEITISTRDKKDMLDNHRALNDLYHELDPSRLTTLACYAMCGPFNRSAHITDLVSWNLYLGWYLLLHQLPVGVQRHPFLVGVHLHRGDLLRPVHVPAAADNNGATNVYFVLILSYVAQFGSSILKLGMFASIMVTVMRAADAVTDPIIGAMMDRTNTRIKAAPGSWLMDSPPLNRILSASDPVGTIRTFPLEFIGRCTPTGSWWRRRPGTRCLSSRCRWRGRWSWRRRRAALPTAA